MRNLTSFTRPTASRPGGDAIPRTSSRPARLAAVIGGLTVALTTVLLTGCATAAEPTTGRDHAATVDHVHAIVPDPTGDGFLLGTHNGIYTATREGDLGSRIETTDFDAMGLAAVGDVLLASGHPGQRTPAELGTPHLGIIRSDDSARTWSAVSFTGEKDFHVLAADAHGSVFGIASDSIELLRSDDLGVTWSPVGEILAFSLVVDASGRLIAATPDGLQLSDDGGATFEALHDAPPIFLLAASPDGSRLVGVGGGGQSWTAADVDAEWAAVGAAHGSAQAITITDDGDIMIFDDSGLTALRD